jgi:hypothetical protein
MRMQLSCGMFDFGRVRRYQYPQSRLSMCGDHSYNPTDRFGALAVLILSQSSHLGEAQAIVGNILFYNDEDLFSSVATHLKFKPVSLRAPGDLDSLAVNIQSVSFIASGETMS